MAKRNKHPARYFFNLVGEHPVEDFDGLELTDEDSARLHTAALAQALMRRSRLFRLSPERWSLQLLDTDRREIAVIAFSEAAKLDFSEAAKLGGVEMHVKEPRRPKGFLLDLLLPPDRAEEALFNILGRYDYWVQKYGALRARCIFTTQSLGVVLTFWADWLLNRVKLLRFLRPS
jgi:hypothetical protein